MATVLITGASRGIGRELADQYAADGWEVIQTCRDPAGAGLPYAIKLDVTDPEDVCDLAMRLKGRPIDVLINNADVIGQRDAAIGTIDYVL